MRPTGDRAREAMFNALGRLLDLRGAAVLDLYAGSGALGLEALSRGAAAVVFVESGPGVLPVLKENLAAVGLPGGRVRRRLGAHAWSAARRRPGSTWCSPTRRTRRRSRRCSACSDRWSAAVAGAGGVLVVERPSREEPWEWPTPLVGLRDRRYGEAQLRYGRSP